MAITRAQQAKQLLAQGGRIGLANGAQFDTSKGGGPISPGTSVGGNTRGGTGKGRDLDVQQRGMTKSEYNRRAAEGTIDRYKGPDGPPKPPQLQEDKRFIPTPVPKGIGFLDRTRNKLIQASLNRNKVLALKRLGLIKDPGFTGFVGTTIDALTGKIPEQFELMSEEDLLDIATSGPYLSQQKTKGDVNKFSSGKDLLGRVFEAEDLLRKGDMTQTKYDKLFPGPDIPEDIGGEGGIQDPCKGPNPPAYCFVGIRSVEPKVEEYVNPLSLLTPRIAGTQFAADGGRIGFKNGPAGGASAGGNYGGNRNPEQEYGGSIFSGGGGGGDGPKTTPTNVGGGNVTTLKTKKDIKTPSNFTKFDLKDLVNLYQDEEDDNMMLADLTDMQKKMLEGPQKNLKDIMGISNEEILQNIEKFNDPNAPATIQDIEEFYQQAKDGGLMSLDREAFLLGGIAKGLKKAVRGVKKIAKSPLGKAALIGAGLGLAGIGPFKGLAGTSFGKGLAGLRGTLFGQAGSRVGEAFVPYKEGLFTKLGLTKGGGSLIPTFKGGITLASILPL